MNSFVEHFVSHGYPCRFNQWYLYSNGTTTEPETRQREPPRTTETNETKRRNEPHTRTTGNDTAASWDFILYILYINTSAQTQNNRACQLPKFPSSILPFLLFTFLPSTSMRGFSFYFINILVCYLFVAEIQGLLNFQSTSYRVNSNKGQIISQCLFFPISFTSGNRQQWITVTIS